MAKEKPVVRGQVAKYEKAFVQYVKAYGAAVVKQVLLTGRADKLRFKGCMNRKDRLQMIKLLGI